MEKLFSDTLESPLGRLALVVDEEGRAVRVRPGGEHGQGRELEAIRDQEKCRRLKMELEEYFSGRRKAFTVPLRLEGTPFQREVWNELLKVPFGRSLSYGELASRLRRPKASRAVGGAVGANPLPILVPCHRVLAAGGIGGYGSGLAKKRLLLELEGIPPRGGKA